MHLFIDPVDGRLDFHEEAESKRALLYELVADLPPVERRVLRWLYGISCEQIEVSEIADRMNLTADQVWLYAEAATDLIGQLLIVEVAA
jgi:hypothetical protein